MTNLLDILKSDILEMKGADQDALYTDIADAAWLAAYFPNLTPSRNRLNAPSNAVSPLANSAGTTVKSPQAVLDSEKEKAVSTNQDPTTTKCSTAQSEEVDKRPKSFKKKRISLPEIPAWRHALDMEHALRPIARRKPSGLQLEIDEDETAHLIAESGVWQAVFSPLPVRWLEAVFIIERSPTMRVWSQPALEFQRMLMNVGAFRWMETFFLDGFEQDNKKPLRLFSAVGNVEHDPDNICHPAMPRVIFLCSDCVGPAWRNGLIPQLLETWSKYNLTIVLQTLPEDDWRRTTLRYANIEEIGAEFPLSAPLIADKPAIPVASLSELQSLRDLANFIIPAQHSRISCFSIKAFNNTFANYGVETGSKAG